MINYYNYFNTVYYLQIMYLAILAILLALLFITYVSPVILLFGLVCLCFYCGGPRRYFVYKSVVNIRDRLVRYYRMKQQQPNKPLTDFTENTTRSVQKSHVENGSVSDRLLIRTSKNIRNSASTSFHKLPIRHLEMKENFRYRSSVINQPSRYIPSPKSDQENSYLSSSIYRNSIGSSQNFNDTSMFQPKYSTLHHLPTVRLRKSSSSYYEPTPSKGPVTVKIATAQSPPSGLSTIQKLTSSFGASSPIHEQRNNLLNALRQNSRKRDKPDETEDSADDSSTAEMKRPKIGHNIVHRPQESSQAIQMITNDKKRSASVEISPSAFNNVKRLKNNSVLSSHSSSQVKIYDEITDHYEQGFRKRRKQSQEGEPAAKRDFNILKPVEIRTAVQTVQRKKPEVNEPTVKDNSESSSRSSTPGLSFESKVKKRNRMLSSAAEASVSAVIYSPTLQDQEKDKEKDVLRLNRIFSQFKSAYNLADSNTSQDKNSSNLFGTKSLINVTSNESSNYTSLVSSKSDPSSTSSTSSTSTISVSSGILSTQVTSTAFKPLSTPNTGISNASLKISTSSAPSSDNSSASSKVSTVVASIAPLITPTAAAISQPASATSALSNLLSVSQSSSTVKDTLVSGKEGINSLVSSPVISSSFAMTSSSSGTARVVAVVSSQKTAVSTSLPVFSGLSSNVLTINSSLPSSISPAAGVPELSSDVSLSKVSSTVTDSSKIGSIGSGFSAETAVQSSPSKVPLSNPLPVDNKIQLGMSAAVPKDKLPDYNTSLKFGSDVQSEPSKPTSASPFQFGSTSTTASSTTVPIQFSSPSTQASISAAPATPFQFGSTATTQGNSSISIAPVQFGSSAPTQLSSASVTQFGSSAASQPKSAGFQFGTSDVTSASNMSTPNVGIQFGSPLPSMKNSFPQDMEARTNSSAAPVNTTSSSSTFQFGSATTTNSFTPPAGLQFGSSATSISSSSSTSGPQFGSTINAQPSNPSIFNSGFQFGANTANKSVTPGLQFGASTTTTVNNPSMQDGALKFGSSAPINSFTGPKGGFQFDTSASSTVASKPTSAASGSFQFGSASKVNEPAATSNAFQFGSPANNSFKTSTPFPSGFTNGGTSTASPAFSFGSAATSQPVATKSLFQFGSNAQNEPKSTTTPFQFGSSPAAGSFQMSTSQSAAGSLQFGNTDMTSKMGAPAMATGGFPVGQASPFQMVNNQPASNFAQNGSSMFTVGSTSSAAPGRRMMAVRRRRQ